MDYQLGLYEKALPADLRWEELMAAVAACGFDYLELSVDENDARLARLAWTGAERGRVRAAARAAGIAVGSICLSAHRRYPLGSPDPAVRARALSVLEGALELACDLGARTVQLAGYDVYYEEGSDRTRELFARSLERAVEMASRAGVTMGFETMETPFMDTVLKAMAYVGAASSPYLGVYPDIGNLSNAALLRGASVAEDLACGQGHIVAAHCKETVSGRYREVSFGTGTTAYAEALGELARQGVRRYVAEMWHTGSEGWLDDVRAAGMFVRTRIDEAFAAKGAGASEDVVPTVPSAAEERGAYGL